MIPTLNRLAHTEVSAFGMPEPANVDGFKAAVRDAVELSAGERLSLSEDFGLTMLSAHDQPKYVLHPEEANLLSPRACTTKRIDCELGRAAAHFALEEIGFHDPVALLRGESGEPLWPDGIVGSITHCYPWSVAIAARSSQCFAVGIDLESLHRMEGPDISELICRRAELDWVHRGHFHQRLLMIFSAKEALYKALYPVCRRYIDFMEVELSWSPEHGCFHVQLLTSGLTNFPADRPIKVHCRCHDNFFFSVVIHKRA